MALVVVDMVDIVDVLQLTRARERFVSIPNTRENVLDVHHVRWVTR
jgi:hypothetical protein